jgi:hypothetical protein
MEKGLSPAFAAQPKLHMSALVEARGHWMVYRLSLWEMILWPYFVQFQYKTKQGAHGVRHCDAGSLGVTNSVHENKISHTRLRLTMCVLIHKFTCIIQIFKILLCLTDY